MKADAINLKHTLGSGQVFLWYERRGIYCIVCSSNVVKVELCNGEFVYESRPEHVDVERFFRMDDDIHAINSSIGCRDALIADAIERFKGLRIMRQDPFQCLISFICATNTNIARVRQMLECICRRFGGRIELDGRTFHTFPSVRALQDASINDLAGCGLGYRARFIAQAVHSYAEIDVDDLVKGCYDDARDMLLSIDGVGSKVADCVMLFSLEKLEAFPIDVWIGRVIARHYRHIAGIEDIAKFTPQMYRRVSSAMRGYFGRYAGYAQQYLYCYARAYM